MRIGFFFRDWYSMQLVLHVIPIEWLRLKVNFLTFNLNHLIKNHSKIQKAKSKKVLKMWEEKRNCMGSQSSSFRMHNETMIKQCLIKVDEVTSKSSFCKMLIFSNNLHINMLRISKRKLYIQHLFLIKYNGFFSAYIYNWKFLV